MSQQSPPKYARAIEIVEACRALGIIEKIHLSQYIKAGRQDAVPGLIKLAAKVLQCVQTDDERRELRAASDIFKLQHVKSGKHTTPKAGASAILRQPPPEKETTTTTKNDPKTKDTVLIEMKQLITTLQTDSEVKEIAQVFADNIASSDMTGNGKAQIRLAQMYDALTQARFRIKQQTTA